MSAVTAITVCVISHGDDSRILRQCLESVLAQEYDDYEVMVVVAPGETETISLLTRMEIEYLNLRHFVTPQDTRFIPYEQLALSLGVMQARYEWVALTQSDCTMNCHWLSAMAGSMTEGKNLVVGPADWRDCSLNRIWRQMTALAVAENGGGIYRADACNTALRKSTFLKSGGFSGSVTLKHGSLQIWANACAGVAVAPSADACVLQTRARTTAYDSIQWLETRRHLKHTWRYRLSFLLDYLSQALAFAALVALLVMVVLCHSEVNAFFDAHFSSALGAGIDYYTHIVMTFAVLLYMAYTAVETNRFNKKARLYYGRAYGFSVCLMKLLFPISWFSNFVDYLFIRRKKFFKTGL